MDIAQLEKIGLKEKEAKVYLSLIKEGQSLAHQLAKHTKILRSSIYDYLDILLEKGFVTYTIIEGKKYFQAVNPEKILDKFKEEKKDQEKGLIKIIKELKNFEFESSKKSKVEVYEGVNGMKSIMSQILKENPKEVLIYGSSGVSYKVLPFFMEQWHKLRIKQKIFLKIIYNKTKETKERIEKGPSLKLAEIRFLPTNSSLTGTVVYKNKVIITFWDQNNPFAILIWNDKIAQNYEENFKILWKESR